MIKGRCRTNLDEGRNKIWPNVFVAVPRKGEYIQCSGSGYSLKVVDVTHSTLHEEERTVPYIIIELNR